ncbi:OmpW family protein [Mitsuaria sp. TWR114]|jgi:outer membrane protein|uniref:OmpW/AlkL family protein n=1 Tax=unclassified Roseateles TaxID=2626991 RepID=UPI0008E9DF72|nr:MULTISPECIES: OmpW family outer membrane protein [unclassified Roseateles]MBB3283292.1 outer membrane protein [Mitsuaria sp. BK037]MBB3295329.1 outer membrane protein [Mitsuaria sp. BK041]MBB3364545.1 outer membrane protein [Mitsuaria sp. BK045]TXD86782.1 OmpW family protein [Mitsuaria sp. TWR114]SFR91041.1 outer membrane protein [Mitsuaria sp. PDC51]
MNKKITLILAASLMALAGAASAETAVGTHTVYLGLAHIDVNSKAAPLEGGTKQFPAPGAQIRVGDATTTGFGYTYRFAPRWSGEIALGIPPSHKIYGNGVIKNAGQIAVVRQMPPTVFINYHLGEYFTKVEPFVGVGVNYTYFEKKRSTPTGDAISGGPTRITLENSWGAAAHVGFTVHYTKQWSLTATAAYADVRSQMRSYTTTNNGTEELHTKINFRPMVYTMSLGYSF